MSAKLDLPEELEQNHLSPAFPVHHPSREVSVRSLPADEADRILRTNSAQNRALQEDPFNVPGLSLPPGLVNAEPPPVAERVGQVAARNQITSPQIPANAFALSAQPETRNNAQRDPENPGLAISNVMIAYEARKIAQLRAIKQELLQNKEKMEKFLAASTLLNALPHDQPSVVSAELKAAFQELQKRGVDLVPKNIDILSPEATITPEQVTAIKSTIANHLEMIRTTNMQIPFMEAEKLTGELKSLYESVRQMQQAINRLIDACQRKVGR